MFFKKMHSKKNQGATLLELLVGFAIIAVVAAGTMEYLAFDKKTSDYARMRNTIAFKSGYFASLLRNRFALAHSAKIYHQDNCISVVPHGSDTCSDNTALEFPIVEPANNQVVIGTEANPAYYNMLVGESCIGDTQLQDKDRCGFKVYAKIIAKCAGKASCPGADAVTAKLFIKWPPAYIDGDNSPDIAYETYLNLRTACAETNLNASCSDPANQAIRGFKWDCSPICVNIYNNIGPDGDIGEGSPVWPVMPDGSLECKTGVK